LYYSSSHVIIHLFIKLKRLKKITDTLNARLIGLVAFIADASVGTECVDAKTILTEIGYGFALVDI